MSASIELPDEIVSRIEADTQRCHLSVAEVIARLTAHLPVREDGQAMNVPAFVGAGASLTGITQQIDELLADSFGRT